MAKTQQQWTRPKGEPAPAPAGPDPAMLAALLSRPPVATVPAKPPLVPTLPWEAIRHRLRLAVRPWYFIGGVGLTGLILHATDAPALGVAAVAGVVTLGVRHFGRRIVRGRDTTAGRRIRHIVYTATGAGAWLTGAAACGGLGSTSGALVASALVPAGALAAVPYWRYVRNSAPAGVELPPPADDAEGLVLDLWRTKLACRKGRQIGTNEIGEPILAEYEGKAAGVMLTGWRRIEGGWAAHMVAPSGTGFDFLAANLRRAIAQAYRVGESAVTITVSGEDASSAELEVQPRSVLAEAQEWPGPSAISFDGGNITMTVGRRSDGTPLLRRAYIKNWGAPSQLALGTSGAGKTEDVKQQFTAERWTAVQMPDGTMKGLFISILHDSGIKQGRDYADMIGPGGIHGFGHTREEAHLIIDAMIREGTRRYEMTRDIKWTDDKGRNRKGGGDQADWNPFVHGPIISVVWDEFHELTKDPAFVAKLETFARLQRGCCMPQKMATHMATIGDTGSQALRDMLAGGSTWLFRTTSALNSALTTGTRLGNVDPRTLPDVPGMCFVASGDETPKRARTSFIPRQRLYDWWYDDNNNPIGYPAVIPQETLDAFGPEWADWQRARAAGVQWKPKATTATGVPAQPKPDDALAPTAVLAVLSAADGPIKFNDIVTQTGMSTSTCNKVLREFTKGGVAAKTAHGMYELTEGAELLA
jgi:hypothetical protein